MGQSGHPSVSEQNEFGDRRRGLCPGLKHSPGSTPLTREDYIQLLLKLGFSGTEVHFPTLWNYKAHESKQISCGWGNGKKNGFGKTENKLLCGNIFRSLHTHTDPQVSPLGFC